MKRPNLFIVGAARSGTTSLWHSLKENPAIFMPQDEISKEPSYFSIKGSWMDQKTYLSLYHEVKPHHKWIGDASTAYLTDPDSAKRIYEYNPDSKIVIVMRNPADRAYSLYNWMVQDGYEPLANFESALEFESSRIKRDIPNWFEPQYYYNYLYFHSGLFYEQVKRYVTLFKNNVYIIRFEEMSENFEHIYQDLCNFLIISPNKIKKTKINASVAIKSATVQFLIRKNIKRIIKNKELRGGIAAGGTNKIRQFLYEKSKEDLTKLNQYVNLSFYHRFIAFNIIKKIFCLPISDLNTIITHKTKAERDFLLKSGFKKDSIPPLKLKTKQKLIQNYEKDIQRLSKLVSSEFLKWLDS